LLPIYQEESRRVNCTSEPARRRNGWARQRR